MQEHELRELGIYRIPIPIPFRQAGGPANVYIVEEDNGLLLFDTGIGLDRSQKVLADGLMQTGHRFEEVNRIVLSHGHMDHFGGAAWVLDQIGRNVPVAIHSADAHKVLESGLPLPVLFRQNAGYLSRLGLPPSVLEEIMADIGKESGMGRQLANVMPLCPGDILQCKHVTLEVLHMPGHTPGLCCLYERNHRILFSADHLLENVSPNPLIELRPGTEPGWFKPLVTYFESLDRLRGLAIDLVLPGHAEPFGAHLDVIDSLHAFYRRRQARLLDLLQREPRTVYELMRELFPSSSAFELFLTMSETLGNLEMLEHQGSIRREAPGDFLRFRKMAGGPGDNAVREI